MTLYQVTQSTDNGNGDTVGTLSYAIRQANVNAGTDAIEFKTNVRITSVMKTLLDSDIVVIGNGKTVSGDANNNGQTDNGDLRPFFIKSGKVDFYDMTITKSTAKGGDGSGGGAGMGGGMFIYGGNVSLSNVTFSNNRAQGGNGTRNIGGGGGMFGNGGAAGISGGGGLFGSSPGDDGGYGGNGNYGGYGGKKFEAGLNGGKGGFGGGGGIGSDGGFGGFGGGGGGGGGDGKGGFGGFGGGGGRGGFGGDGGYGGGGGGGGGSGGGGDLGDGGFGGGFGNRYGFGGGGAGMGGAMFIRSGSLTLNGVNLNNNSAIGGSGAENGKGLGGALFIMQRTTNTNPNNLGANNQGMPTTLPTVVSEGPQPTYSGNSASDDEGPTNLTNNDNVFGTVETGTDSKAGNDTINGTNNSDTLDGGAGDDTINGLGSNDILIGGIGNDTTNGGAGSDIVYGGRGNDNLNGGAGNDSLIGGAGVDRFIFNSGQQFTQANAEQVGRDTITDFEPGTDKIVLSKTTFTGIDSAVGNGFSQSAEFLVVETTNALSNLLLGTLGSVNIVYNQETGGLNYISDNPLNLRFTRIATIQGRPTLDASDFQITP